MSYRVDDITEAHKRASQRLFVIAGRGDGKKFEEAYMSGCEVALARLNEVIANYGNAIYAEEGIV